MNAEGFPCLLGQLFASQSKFNPSDDFTLGDFHDRIVVVLKAEFLYRIVVVVEIA